MHLNTSLANHTLQTAVPIRHKVYNKALKLVSVNKPYKAPYTFCGEKNNLADVLQRNKQEIANHFNAEVNADKGTIGNIPVIIKFVNFVPHNPTTKELDCNTKHKWWRCIKNNGEKQVITSCFLHGDKKCMPHEQAAQQSALFAPEEAHNVPDSWIVKEGEESFIIHNEPAHETQLEIITETFYKTGKLSSDIIDAFQIDVEASIRKEYPIARKPPKELGAEIRTEPLHPSEKILYRLLFWSGELKINRENFYKGGIHNLRLGKTGALACFYFYKRELAVALWCPKSQITPSKPKPMPPIRVICGVPGSKDNYAPKASDKVMEKWNFLIKLLKTKTEIYSGNNFFV